VHCPRAYNALITGNATRAEEAENGESEYVSIALCYAITR
jgi:hypothetical protein